MSLHEAVICGPLVGAFWGLVERFCFGGNFLAGALFTVIACLSFVVGSWLGSPRMRCELWAYLFGRSSGVDRD